MHALLNFEILSLVIEVAKTKIVKVDYHLVKSGQLRMKQCCVKDNTKLFCDSAINCNTIVMLFQGRLGKSTAIYLLYYLLFQVLGIALSLQLINVHLQQQNRITWQGGFA